MKSARTMFFRVSDSFKLQNALYYTRFDAGKTKAVGCYGANDGIIYPLFNITTGVSGSATYIRQSDNAQFNFPAPGVGVGMQGGGTLVCYALCGDIFLLLNVLLTVISLCFCC